MSDSINKIKNLEEQVSKLQESFDDVAKLLSKPNRRFTTDSMFDEEEILPITTFDELDNFELLLNNDTDFRKKIVNNSFLGILHEYLLIQYNIL